MFYSKFYRAGLFTLLLLAFSSAHADYHFQSIDGCVVEIKDWNTMYTDLVNLKSVANFKYNESEKKAKLIYIGMGKTFAIAKLKKNQATEIKHAYLQCTNQ